MKDLKFEQKHPMSRFDAADLLTAFAEALRKGDKAEVELIGGTLELRVPDELVAEVEFEIGDGEVELEIEFKWPTGAPRRVAAPAAAAAPDAERPATPAKSARSRKTAAPAKRTRSGGADGSARTKRTAAKKTA
ncbi:MULTISPECIES: amphi-Trp domain-containing protein [unclassified Streptomyces]|uniref:amphi-Trp domain-containing protein n=1 Tax=Streptomyces sp. NPDC127129 TaxID=3345373 RepID=UPI003633046D